MTRHKHAHTGLVTPQLPQHWLTAALRVFAMLVLNVASTLQMTRRRDPVIGTQDMPSRLPRETTDTPSKETNPAVQPDSSPKALILRDRMHDVRTAELPRAIVSKDEGVLTTLSPSFLRKQEPRSHAHSACRPWLPALRFAPAGMTRIERHVGSIEDAPSGSVNPVHAFPAKAGIQTSLEKSARSADRLDPRLRGGCVLRDLARQP